MVLEMANGLREFHIILRLRLEVQEMYHVLLFSAAASRNLPPPAGSEAQLHVSQC